MSHNIQKLYLHRQCSLMFKWLFFCYSKDTREKKNSELLKIIYTGGNSAYDAFRQALIETTVQKFLAEKLPDFTAGGNKAQGSRDETEAVSDVIFCLSITVAAFELVF